MVTHQIRTFGDPVLRRATAEVTGVDGAFVTLVDAMLATMYEAPGVGLAANQVGIQQRFFVYDVGEGPGVLVNPEVVDTTGEWAYEEGCLSLPGLTYDTRRAMRVVATGMNMHGEPVTIEGSELLARCVQHETDHLDGILFIDRLDTAARKVAMMEIRESEWFGAPAPVVRFSPHSLRPGLG